MLLSSSPAAAQANIPPTIRLSQSSDGRAYTAPATVTLSAAVSDPDGRITRVDFYNGSTRVSSDTSAPFSYTRANVGVGVYTFFGIATDNRGATTKSAIVTTTVLAPNAAPTVSLTAPANGATYTAPATLQLTATAADVNGSVAKVEFFAGATLLGSDTTSPYTASAANLAVGVYSLTAVATDNVGTTTRSAAITVTVKAPNTPPTVALTAPAAGAIFTGPASIAMTASASDPGGSIAKVEFFSGATLLGTDTTAPYAFTATGVTEGTYALTAVATDNSGGTTRSAVVSITVNPGNGSSSSGNTAPTVALTAPAAGSAYTAPATLVLAATAADLNGQVVKVDFFAGQTLLGTDTTAPYGWNAPGVAAGAYALTAVATDDAGASTRSAAVTITVSTTPTNLAPSVSISTPAGGTSFTSPAAITITAAAADTDGTVARVDFYSGATLLASDTTAPYGTVWSGVGNGTYSLTAVAVDNSGTSTRSAAVLIVVSALGTGSASPGALPLVQQPDLRYVGSFRVPAGLRPGGIANLGFDYGGTAISFDPARGGLFMVGHDWDQFVGEVSTPQPGTGALTSLPTATMLQPLTDPAEGKRLTIDGDTSNGVKIGGTLPYNGKLYFTAYSFYDGLGLQTRGHFTSGTDLSIRGDVAGPYAVGNLGAGFVAGYLGHVPPEWQAPLGGPVLTGLCCISIISRSSYGPAVSAIDPALIGVAAPAPDTPLLYYPSAHPTIGTYGGSSLSFNGTTEIKGLVFPSGTRTVLFFGRTGAGPWCYGQGTADPSLAGTDYAPGVPYCYDPESPLDKGPHQYPYRYQIWAYDASQLAAVKAGALQPWEVTPYGVWPLSLPYSAWRTRILGAAYDPATGRIFLSQSQADGPLPLVHVFSIVLP